MAEFGHYFQLVTTKISRPPIRNIFELLGSKPDGVSYEINPGLPELLHNK